MARGLVDSRRSRSQLAVGPPGAREVPSCSPSGTMGRPPCQDVAGVNAARVGLSGSRSWLVTKITEVHDLLWAEAPYLHMYMKTEFVTSLDHVPEDVYSAEYQMAPMSIFSSWPTGYKRPRYYWIGRPGQRGEGVELVTPLSASAPTVGLPRDGWRRVLGWLRAAS